MLQGLWKLFIEAIWPLLWPIFRDLMTEVAQDLAAWIKRVLSDKFDATAASQERQAQQRAAEAQERAQASTDQNERLRAEAEANAWREVVEQLRIDNAKLRMELEEVVKQSQVYARKRIDSEAEQSKVQDRVFSLKPPQD